MSGSLFSSIIPSHFTQSVPTRETPASKYALSNVNFLDLLSLWYRKKQRQTPRLVFPDFLFSAHASHAMIQYPPSRAMTSALA